MLKVLDLFSGIGGFSLGLERTGGFETVAFCEIEPFAQRVLKKHWPDVPCFDDVRKLTGADIGPVDVICGGYPCQPFSSAGKRQGAADDRHLWPEFMRLVAELRPSWVIGENVAGHISMGLDDVLADLETEGYACRTFIIPACAVGASHRRDRVWTVGYSDSKRGAAMRGQRAAFAGESLGGRYDRGGSSCDAEWQITHASSGENPGHVSHAASEQDRRRQQRRVQSDALAGGHDVADTIGNDAQRQQPSGLDAQERAGPQQRPTGPCSDGGRGRGVESRMGRMADGFSCWLDEPGERVKAGVKGRAARLKALGNAVHPDIPMMIGRAILEAEAQEPHSPGAHTAKPVLTFTKPRFVSVNEL